MVASSLLVSLVEPGEGGIGARLFFFPQASGSVGLRHRPSPSWPFPPLSASFLHVTDSTTTLQVVILARKRSNLATTCSTCSCTSHIPTIMIDCLSSPSMHTNLLLGAFGNIQLSLFLPVTSVETQSGQQDSVHYYSEGVTGHICAKIQAQAYYPSTIKLKRRSVCIEVPLYPMLSLWPIWPSRYSQQKNIAS